MEAKIDQYFDYCEEKGKTPTVPGLCVFLGFESRQSFLDYEAREKFSGTIKKARLKIEADRADRLVSSGTPTAGLIFDLTNNHGWKNPQHLKHSQDEDGEPQKVEHTVKAGDALTGLLEELARLKAGTAKPG
jgi:hypothetical protein